MDDQKHNSPAWGLRKKITVTDLKANNHQTKDNDEGDDSETKNEKDDEEEEEDFEMVAEEEDSVVCLKVKTIVGE